MRCLYRFVLITLLLVLGAGPGVAADGAAVREIGAYAVHYNAMRASALDPALAQRHDLPRDGSTCIVTVAVIRRDTGMPVKAQVMGEATREDGRMTALDLREIRQGNELYYVADLAIEQPQRIRFTLEISPGGTMPPETIHFSRVFDPR